MLATNRLPCARAASMRLMWPACRLPIVGTNTTRSPAECHSPMRARTCAIVVTVCMPALRTGSSMELVLRGGIGLLLDRLHVARERVGIGSRPLHEILHEARLATGSDVEHVVEHEDLP